MSTANNKFRILFVHHVGIMGGSSRSLYENFKSVNETDLDLVLMSPGGVMAERVVNEGLATHFKCRFVPRFDQTYYSHYRGWRWLIFFLREIPFTFYFFFKAMSLKSQYDHFDIIHFNDSLLVQPAFILKRFYPKTKMVFHARAVLTPRKGWAARLFYSALDRFADYIFPIDQTVERSIDLKKPMTKIHDGFNFKARDFARVPKETVVVAMVGIIAKAKGSVDFAKAATMCLPKNKNLKFMVYGAGREPGLIRSVLIKIGFGEFAEKEVRQILEDSKITDSFEIRGFEMDLDRLYRNVDIICFPGRLDAPGRPIFEAAFYQIPSVVCISRPTQDTFREGITGFSVPQDDPQALAEKILHLADNTDVRLNMGRSAQQLALENFDNEKNTKLMFELFRRISNI